MTLFKNGLFLQLHPSRVEEGDLRVGSDGRIAALGAGLQPEAGEEVVDLAGRAMMPGLVNGHTHLYSALACGMPAPRHTPRDFLGILEEVWWWMDRALDHDITGACGLAGAMDAAKCGTTGMIDHHASPNAIDGSLDALSAGIARVGLRAALCYEATDRHGEEDGLRGVAESARYATAAKENAGKRAGMIGLHAPFTCGPATMAAARKAADAAGGAPLHIHVAEDRGGRAITRARYGRDLADYLIGEGIVGDGARTLIAHGVHLDGDEIARLAKAGAWFTHQSRSNQNNGVGHAKLDAIPAERLLIGTDGIGADMFAEGQAAFFKSRDAGTGLTPERVVEALATNARFLGEMIGEPKLGTLEVGAPADLVELDWIPATPVAAGSLPWHFVFSLGSRHVARTYVGGAIVYERGDYPALDGGAAAAGTALRAQAKRLFSRMEALD